MNGTGSILAAKPAPPEPSALRAKFTKATKAGRTKLLGTDSGTARKIAAVAVLTDRGNCQSLYLVQLTDTTDGNHVYVATKSNDPAKPIPIVLPEDLFNDAAVVVPKALFTDADITAATDRGYVLFDSFTKTSRPDLASLIPSSAGSDEEHFVVVGPKCLALVYGDFGYHGAADDSARSALEASQGSSVTKLFLAMKEHFNLNTQQWLVTNSASVPDEFFKKPHGTRPLVDNSFAVPVTGPGEDVGDDELEELSSAIRAHLPLPQIPRKIDPTRTLGLDDDDDTLASVTQGGLTERESRVWLNLGTLSFHFHFTCSLVSHNIIRQSRSTPTRVHHACPWQPRLEHTSSASSPTRSSSRVTGRPRVSSRRPGQATRNFLSTCVTSNFPAQPSPASLSQLIS